MLALRTQTSRLLKVPHVRTLYNRSRIGNRDVVGFGINGSYIYKDDVLFPFPAVRFMENTPAIAALRLKERGDWKQLTCEEKKALYRASFCQTFSEFQYSTGSWMFIVGWGLIMLGCAFWFMTFYHFYVRDDPPESLSPVNRSKQLRRMIDLRMNPVDGLGSKWNYLDGAWKCDVPEY